MEQKSCSHYNLLYFLLHASTFLYAVMSGKRKCNKTFEPNKCKWLTIEQNLEIIKRHEEGASYTKIATSLLNGVKGNVDKGKLFQLVMADFITLKSIWGSITLEL